MKKLAAKVHLTVATPKDAAEVYEISRVAWQSTYPHSKGSYKLKDELDREVMESVLKRGKAKIMLMPESEMLLVAKLRRRIIGICRVTRYPDQNQLRAICVHPHYQRKGVGTILWEAAKHFLDLSKDVIVKVEKHNKKAINFYKKMGFEMRKLVKKEESAFIPEITMILKAPMCKYMLELKG